MVIISKVAASDTINIRKDLNDEVIRLPSSTVEWFHGSNYCKWPEFKVAYISSIYNNPTLTNGRKLISNYK